MVTKTLFSQYRQMKNTLRTDKDMRDPYRIAFQYFDKAIHSETFFRWFPNEEEARELIEDIELTDKEASSKRDIEIGTYRSRRTRFSERVTSIFGCDPLHILIKGKSEELPRLVLSCLILINDDLVSNELTKIISDYKSCFMNDLSFVEKDSLKYEISDCQGEIDFMRKYSLRRMSVDAGKVDSEKVLYLLSIAEYGTPFEKAGLLEKYIGQLSNQFEVFASIVKENEKLSTKDSRVSDALINERIKEEVQTLLIVEKQKLNHEAKELLKRKINELESSFEKRVQDEVELRVKAILEVDETTELDEDNLFDNVNGGFEKQQL